MNLLGVPIIVAVVSGIAAVYLFPPQWLAPLSGIVAFTCVIFAIIINVDNETRQSSNPITGFLLLMFNLPSQPSAKVKENWALTAFLSSAAFLISLGFSVMVRANA